MEGDTMERSYAQEMATWRQASAKIGAYVGLNITKGFTPEQRRRFTGKNIMTDERVECRKIAMGAAVVEISYGQGIGGGHMWGLTVFDLCRPERDHDLSGCYDSAEEAADRLRYLHKEFAWEGE